MRVEFYTKPRCGLCDEARRVTLSLLDGRQFEWVEHDITRSPALFEEYRYDIPVVVVDGREVARLHVDPRALARLLGL